MADPTLNTPSEWLQRLRDLIASLPDRLACYFMQDDDELCELRDRVVELIQEKQVAVDENIRRAQVIRGLEDDIIDLQVKVGLAEAELAANRAKS